MDKYEINDFTGFMNGDLFESDEEVNGYFTIKNMIDMFGECDLSQPILDQWADFVIRNKIHMK